MKRTYYLAEWYDEDAVSEDGFEPDQLRQSSVEDFDKAKHTAMAKALNSAIWWARVTRVEVNKDGSKDYGPAYVNEHVDGAWSGWLRPIEELF
jgi:hypothetical protein